MNKKGNNDNALRCHSVHRILNIFSLLYMYASVWDVLSVVGRCCLDSIVDCRHHSDQGSMGSGTEILFGSND
jgi:hypothetical protein